MISQAIIDELRAYWKNGVGKHKRLSSLSADTIVDVDGSINFLVAEDCVVAVTKRGDGFKIDHKEYPSEAIKPQSASGHDVHDKIKIDLDNFLTNYADAFVKKLYSN
jgi:hypothetical protein